MKNSFKTINKKIEEPEDEDSDLTNSDSEDINGYSHFRFHNNVMEPHKGFQMSQTDSNNHYQTPVVVVVLQQAPEKRIKKVLLEKSHSDSIYIKLSKVILLDIQSIMDLI